jgi:hypothetical protein
MEFVFLLSNALDSLAERPVNLEDSAVPCCVSGYGSYRAQRSRVTNLPEKQRRRPSCCDSLPHGQIIILHRETVLQSEHTLDHTAGSHSIGHPIRQITPPGDQRRNMSYSACNDALSV